MIPDFDTNGNLPKGIHFATWEEFTIRYNLNPKRAWLIEGIEQLIAALKRSGCKLIYIDGSFVTAKDQPGDYDACWSISDVDPHKLDPILLGLSTKDERSRMKAKYRGDVFPAEIPEGSSGRRFVDFFQTDKDTGEEKGIVAIRLGGTK